MSPSVLFVVRLFQFHMKLEEKMHAKEAGINQIQARTQVGEAYSIPNLLFKQR